MELLGIGAVLRAVRIRKGWRQIDVARAAGVSQTVVSRVERGRVRRIKVDVLLRLAEAVDVRLDCRPWWRGGDLDRMLNAGHAAMHDAAVKVFAGTQWELAPETTFAIFGERGAIDLLAFHPTGALLVVELKTELVDVQGLLSAVDRYRRLAPRIASDRGWRATSVSVWIAFRDTATNRRRVAAHAGVLRAAYPHGGRPLRGWLKRPVGTVSALSFLADASPRASAAGSGVRRVRPRRAVTPPVVDHAVAG